MRRLPLLGLVSFFITFGCSPESGKETASAKAEPPVAVPAPQQAAAPVSPELLRQDLQPHLDLQALAHLADVDQGGLFFDFGTPARHKYTVGNWNTGWGKDISKPEGSFTLATSAAARMYVPLPTEGAFRLRVRVKPIGTGTLQLYLNEKQLPAVSLQRGDAFVETDIPVPAGLAREGENHLLLRFGGTKRVRGQDLAAAVDYVRVLPVSGGESTELPRYDTLVREVAVGGSRRLALVLNSPATLSYHIEVPKDGVLRFGVAAPGGKVAAKVSVTPASGRTQVLWSGEVGGSWQKQGAALSSLAGQVVKLEFAAEGAGQIAWSQPEILVPEVKLAAFEPVKQTIVLLIDTLRASKLQLYNPSEVVRTPALNTLGEEGTVFDAAQSAENWTKPSVASVLTSLYPMTHGTKRTESKLPQDALMVSEVFKRAGFSTASFLANGYVSNKFGFDQGWDYYTNYIRENKSTVARNVFRDAGNWIEKHKGDRFFVYIQTIDPHVPYDPPGELLREYDPKPYSGIVSPRRTADLLSKAKAVPPKVRLSERDREHLEALHNAEITYHDNYLGEFIERLKRLGLYDNVMFVVTSDHGEEFYEHGSYGHGHSVFQEMIHVPMMFRRPGLVPGGQRMTSTVSTMDITPTVLSAAGLDVPEVMEGHSQLDHIRGGAQPGPAVAFTDFLYDQHVIRAGRYKLIVRGIKPTLYDLQRDPGEKTALELRQHPVAMRYCRNLLGQFLGATDRTNWLAPNREQHKARQLRKEDTRIDAETHEQLKALGYAN